MAAFSAVSGSPRAGRLTVVGLVAVPLVIGGVLAWALAAPVAHPERVTAAIVNDDEPVTVDGSTVPLGREFAAGLMAAQEPAQPGEDPVTTPGLDWVLTNDDEAEAGLASGSYAAVVRIPASFSADATSISGPASQATQASVEVRTTAGSAWLDPALTTAVTQAATDALGRELTTRYLGQLYGGFNTIATQIAQAAAGAEQVAAGAAGVAQGAEDLTAGAGQLAAGLTSLDAGAADLAAGMSSLDRATQRLPATTADLSRAADELARVIDGAARGLDEATVELTAVAAALCATPGPVCDRARQAIERLVGVDEDLTRLALLATGVAGGNDALAAVMPGLAGAVTDASRGASALAMGAGESSTGASSLAGGAAQLSSGAGQVDAGAASLSAGLDSASTQLPTYSDDDIEVLSAVVAEPVTLDQSSPQTGIQSVPLFTMIALWLGGLVIALAVQAVPQRRLLLPTGSARLAARAIAGPAAIGAAQGIVLAAVVLGSVLVTPLQWLSFAGAAILVGAVSAVANQGLVAAFGGAGRLVAVLIGVVALAAGLASTVPPVISALAGSLPTAAAAGLVRAPLVGDAAGVVPALIGLILTAAAGFLLVVGGVAARRRVAVVDDQ